MIPPVIATPATTAPISQLNRSVPISPSQPSGVSKFGTGAKVSIANWQDRAPLTSPDLHATPAAYSIAQSELPGGRTPPIPPSPSIKDTGEGYPSRIPRNYFGPAISTGNNGSFGVISRFAFSENYSLRPSAIFGGNGTIIRVPFTYDFVFSDKEPFERNPVVTFHAGGGFQYSSGVAGNNASKFSLLATVGVDVNLFEGIALVSSYNTDFSSINGVNFGVGFEF
jgi:hypothetical protein